MAARAPLPLLRRLALACIPTAENVLGPMYRKGAPFRDRLCPPDEPGTPLTVSGTISGAPSCEPLTGALLDVWQTNDRGLYSNLLGLNFLSLNFLSRADPKKPGAYNLRGRMRTDDRGRYRFESVLPGRYPLWVLTRPRHIHFRVSHPGHCTLVTQLYVADDPYLGRDPWVKESLIVPLEEDPDRPGRLRAVFDIVLEVAGWG